MCERRHAEAETKHELSEIHVDSCVVTPSRSLLEYMFRRKQRRPPHAAVSALRLQKVSILSKQRLEDLLVFFVVLKSVDIHGVVDN